MCSIVLAFSVFGFTNDNQGLFNPPVTVQQRVNEKAVFDHDQILYNDRTNKAFRDDKLIKNEIKDKDQDKKKVEEDQDKTKGQILIKF